MINIESTDNKALNILLVVLFIFATFKKESIKKSRLKIIGVVILYVLISTPTLAQNKIETGNLLSNPAFDFHSFINHRLGEPVSFSSHNVAFWNTDAWGDIEVMRESHVSAKVRPKFSTHNMVSINPGKKIWQFFTLPEAGLAHGDSINLSVYGYQLKGNQIRAVIKLMKLDSEDGKWSPKDFGMRNSQHYPRHSRGELVVAKEYSIIDQNPGTVLLKIKNAIIEGKTSVGNISHSNDMNTIGIQVEFENTDQTDTTWIYAPNLTAENTGLRPVSFSEREMIPYYRYIPRTIQKLWKGESLHIIVMGSSIDRASANPPMYLYNEDPLSKDFKQPIAEGLFDAAKVGRPDLEEYFGEWRHYYSYAGRLKMELMRKFNLTADKICLNFMASDGSSIGESHSGLKEYCSLSIPPDPGLNGHKKGKSWKELYPDLFTRPEGQRPDLIIFGSGANEKTDTPDEVAVFEGAIRWIQRHYPNTEFLFCQFQSFGSSANNGDLQALSLRYQIPLLDYGKIGDDITRWCNRYSLVPADGHPQAAAHYLWFKVIEKAFETWDPILPGQVQLQLPERLHQNSYGWEGEFVTFDSGSARIKTNRFIFEDNVINCWGKVDNDPPVPYVDGVKMKSRRSFPHRDIRNSMFRFGNTSLGDRHILEIKGKNALLTSVDAKINANRRFYPINNANWKIAGNKVSDFTSEWGAPYGSSKISLQSQKSIELEAMCTDLSVAYVDKPDGGIVEIFVDDQLKLSQPSNVGFVDTDKKVNYLENRKGILNLNYGLHKVRLTAKGNAVDILGVFTYDSRPNLGAERRLEGTASGGDVVEFTLPFKAKPLVICSGGITVISEDISTTQVKFSGTSGSYQVIGE